jgi:glucosamine--fructose-6-phosphate aminotransferase (isomerizing)
MTAFEDLLTWRESSTSGDAIGAALGAADGAPAAALDLLTRAGRIVITGAGSSYYLAQAAAATARTALHRPVLAAPLSELILRPDGVLADASTIGSAAGRDPVVIISRSGSTSEAVDVAERMRRAGHPTIAVTCRADSPLARTADVALVSPEGDEAAIVMTRSFASMLALLLRLIASVAGDDGLAADLGQLGGGPAFGIAAEWGLKLTETSQVPTNAYEPLEFRHGPISVCEPGMLVVGLVGGPGAADEVAVVREAAALGATTWLLARDADETSGAGGEVSRIGGGLHPAARLPLLLHPAHALALGLALTRGCDPDAPRHLGQVVILDRE